MFYYLKEKEKEKLTGRRAGAVASVLLLGLVQS
jgi:hypothetical protein